MPKDVQVRKCSGRNKKKTGKDKDLELYESNVQESSQQKVKLLKLKLKEDYIRKQKDMHRQAIIK